MSVKMYTTAWCGNSKRQVPTFDIGGRFVTMSPFDARRLAEVLHIELSLL